jgi:O-antigen ligase
LLAGALSVVFAPSRTAALGLYRAYLIEPIAFAFVLAHVVYNARRALMVVGGLAIAAVWVAVPNIVVVLQALAAHTYDVTQTPPVVIYTTANALALFLGPILAVGASIALYSTERFVRVVAIAFLVIAVLGMLLTFSRGGYLAMAAVGIGLAISHPRRWTLLAGEAVAAIVLFLLPPIRHRVLLEFQNVNGTTFFGRAGRIELWKATLQMLRQHVVFGAGLSGFADRIGPYWNATHPERFIDPHNIVLNLWSETGLLGLAAFAWILVVGFMVAWRGWHESAPAWRPLELGVLLALVAIVVHGLVDVPYFKNDLSLQFWALIGVAYAGANPPSMRRVRAQGTT